MSEQKKFPRQPERFNNRLERMRAHAKSDSVMWKIPAVVMLEVRCLQRAYWGGEWHTVWALFYEALWNTWQDFKCNLRIRICDWVGWTKIYWYPETERMIGYHRRHGAKCSGSPNCHNDHCIEDSVPKWYRKLTGWVSLDELADEERKP